MRDLLVKIALKLGLYKTIVACINWCKAEVLSRKMRRTGLEMLQTAEQAFDEAGVKAFLTYGVLLGAIREHGFISYDPDIDLGVLANEIPANLHERLQRAGFQLYKQNYIRETGVVIEETYLYKKLHLDIFYYFEEGDDYYSVIPRRHETKEWKEANATDGFPCDHSYVQKTDFQRIDFLGVQVWTPVKAHEWLTDIYSDSYMTPVKNWSKENYKTRILPSKERAYRRGKCIEE